MKIISLWAPWAHLWAGGKKRIETRGKNWFPNERPPFWVAVHAAKTTKCLGQCATEPFRSALLALGYAQPGRLPLGAVVGVVRVAKIYRFHPSVPLPPGDEVHFGDFATGRYGYVTDRNLMFQTPIPLRGQQGVWSWQRPEDAKLVDRLTDQLGLLTSPKLDETDLFGRPRGPREGMPQ